MAISNMDQVAAAMAVGQKFRFTKSYSYNEQPGVPISYWADGQDPGTVTTGTLRPTEGSRPTLAGEVPTRATVGALGQANPASGKKLYLCHYSAAFKALSAAGTPGCLAWLDRLWHNYNCLTNVTVDTSFVATADVDRPNGTDPNELWAEFDGGYGSTPSVLTVKYTNTAGTTGRTATLALPAGPQSGSASVGMFRIQLEAGDTGVRRPTSYFFTPSTGGAFNFAVVVARPVTADLHALVVGVSSLYDFASLGMPEVYPDACLFAVGHTGNTVAHFWRGHLGFMEEA